MRFYKLIFITFLLAALSGSSVAIQQYEHRCNKYPLVSLDSALCEAFIHLSHQFPECFTFSYEYANKYYETLRHSVNRPSDIIRALKESGLVKAECLSGNLITDLDNLFFLAFRSTIYAKKSLSNTAD